MRLIHWLVLVKWWSVTLIIVYCTFVLLKSGTTWSGPPDNPDRLETAPAAGYSQGIDESSDSSIRSQQSPHQLLVIILTYQRCGSTFFGQLFNWNPDIFYMFEPLDALYTSMYGTAQGWNIPSDITSFSNGSERRPPTREVTRVADFISHILDCEMTSIQPDLLDHVYYEYFPDFFAALKDYFLCKKRNKVRITSCGRLRRRVNGYCGRRFGQNSEHRQTECFHLLNSLVDPRLNLTAPPNVRQDIEKYRSCLADFKTKASRTCTSVMERSCSNRQVRVIKLVRATMDSIELLLQSHPNLRIIHLIRDPRGVALSRSKMESARGLYSGSNNETVEKEAMVYCRSAVTDIRTRLKLEKKYPDAFYPLVYDDLVADRHKYASAIHKFLRLPMHNSTLEWIQSGALDSKERRNASQIAGSWKNEISVRMNSTITDACRELFSLVRRDWNQ